MKILIVDDEKPARDRLSRMVGVLNEHELVGEAVNGVEALGMTQSLEPDIVLMDIRMPGMDGIEAARHIARLQQPPAVIFTTAYSDHALEAFEIQGIKNNIPAVVAVLRSEPFRAGRVHTGLIPEVLGKKK